MSRNYWPTLCCQKIVLPIALLISCSVRQNGLSFIYLILLLSNPFVPIATSKTVSAGCAGQYLFLNILFPVLNSVAQLTFQFVLFSYPTYGSIVEPPCSSLERILRYIGLIQFRNISVWSAFHATFPEIVMLIISIVVYIMCRAMNPQASVEENLLPIVGSEFTQKTATSTQRRSSVLAAIGKYVCLLSICIAGIIQPSVQGFIYFLFFLGCMTWWAYNRNLSRGFGICCCFILALVTVHITAIFFYQTQWAQELVPADHAVARFSGLIPLFTTSCTDPRQSDIALVDWTSYLNPLILVWLYFILVYESAELLRPPPSPASSGSKNRTDDRAVLAMAVTTQDNNGSVTPAESVDIETDRNIRKGDTEATPLIRGRESVYRKSGGKYRTYIQDSHGSVTVSDETDDASRPRAVLEEGSDGTQGILEVVFNGMIAIAQLIAQSSYIGTNIIMMAWSIMYHSWLAFVLLLWASAMWMLPNQRRAMLRSSPFLVFYAEILLIVQYIYGMNLNSNELPSHIKGFNLKQIGFEKLTHFTLKPLLIKTLFTLMFWMTLRQYNQEKWEERNSSALADMVAPLQLGMGTATTMGTETQTKTSLFIQRIGKQVRLFLIKYWIWVVAIFLFWIGISGDRMTIFRIVYMALALIFILTFQLSWTLWRKMMYGFWLTVIIYSMLILVLTYTYQFDNFEKYWEVYLHIPLQLQLDIGLERFETTELFVRLLTPTFFVIITVIQLYYFHKDFLAISDIKSRGTSSVRPSVRSSSLRRNKSDGKKYDPKMEIEVENEETAKEEPGESSKFLGFIDLGHGELKNLITKVWSGIESLIELIWLYLELHMLKIIMFAIMMLAVYDVCAMHFILVLLTVIALTFGSNVQTLSAHISSVLVSILLLAKMVYQIEYIDHSRWDVSCNTTGNETQGNNTNVEFNSASWLGFEKTSANTSLLKLLRGYIAVILIVTVHTVVTTRQKYKRHLKGRSLVNPVNMFPRITYKDADKDIKHCLKYLMNFGFYRFGVEMCLIAVVALIGTRMDIWAVLYGFWLCALISPDRNFLSKIWGVFTLFIVTTIPLQYLLVVGLPPSLCLMYPWHETETLQRFQEWMFLSNPHSPLPAYKIMCDFIVLLLVCRQAVVFRIERRHLNHEYSGGTNKSIVNDVEKLDYVNPVPDFMTTIRSYLDVLKRIFLIFFIWFAMIFVFLAGTNRVNLFSLGYLFGSFIFFWQGNELYLRPINVILRWWRYLITYNVAVIVLKALSQILGCIFIKHMLEAQACWIIELFGIGCIKKFGTYIANDDPVGCLIPQSDVGLAWDGFCFTFLILQRRLFNSHYFVHIVNETKAMTILASRGAELIQDLSEKQISEQQEAERKILEKIKNKMDRIKASQQKVHGQGPEYREPPNHDAAIRSGDYYMFEDMDEELDLIEEQKSESEEDEGTNVPTVSQFLSSAMKTDITSATEKALAPKLRRVPSDMTLYLPTQPSSMGPRTVSAPALTNIIRPEVHGSWKSAISLPHAEAESQPGPSTEGLEGEERRRLEKKDEDKDGRGAESLPPDSQKSEPPKTSLISRLILLIRFLWAFINSVMVTMTKALNKFSKDYRFVMRALSVEKKLLKEKEGFGQGVRTGSSMVWHPLPYIVSSKPKVMVKLFHSVRRHFSRKPKINQDKVSSVIAIEPEEMSTEDRHPFTQLVLALWYALISHSELVCYFMIFLHQIKSATILSLPLPLMVFLWGTLTVPRPSKNFWISVIAYTQIVVIIKCMFQFQLLSWEEQAADNRPFFPPRIIGIEKKSNYATYDLMLLLIVFAHRSMLKSLGLWKTTEEAIVQEETETENKNLPISGTIKNKSKKFVKHIKQFFNRKYESKNTLTSEVEEDPTSTSTTHPSVSSLYTKDEKFVVIKYPVEDPCEFFPQIIPITAKKYLSPAHGFFKSLLEPSIRVTTDVYAYMFFCDFFNLLVVIFGFASFGTQQGDGGVSQYFEENKVPFAFLVMLILQFGLIIIDRTLYLRKFILGKIIFQFILVFGIHIWMFFVLPAVTERQFNAAVPPQMWYMVKCFYLLLSAYQIRSGYPTRILGNFLCKSYNYVNMYLFKVFMLVPFVFELRALMDWIWTDTSMTLSDWLKMEDIFAHIFQLKCQRRAEEEYPQPRGEKKAAVSKYIVGGGFLIGIIAVIWFPLVLFALGDTVGQPNLPYEVGISLRIGGYQPIYSMSARNNSIYKYDEKYWTIMNLVYKKSRVAQTFLSNYNNEDIGVVRFSSHSTAIWTISPPDLTSLIDEALSSNPMIIKLDWRVLKVTQSPEQQGEAVDGAETILYADDPNRQRLVEMLKNVKSDPIYLRSIFPKFLKVTNRGNVSPISQLMSVVDDGLVHNPYRNVSVHLERNVSPGNATSVMWWVLKEDCTDKVYEEVLKKLPHNNCEFLVMYTFNDKAFPATLNFISGKGLIGLYTLTLLGANRLIRRWRFQMSFHIMYDELPYVDRILQLCYNIFLVRDLKDYSLEEDLYAKLVFIYRSPQTMIEVTRPPVQNEPAIVR
ncbi:piezo type mechanosensitive ion channel component isoform X3 [Lycorma delicatula]|uniref:piezo type mechanosensitive ion channel component isoform X3 n=1 Tax=Lycorma delicatula TaxID=130591 RepID=UPI003F510CA5